MIWYATQFQNIIVVPTTEYRRPKISKFPSNQLYLKTFQLLFFIHLLKRLIRQPRVSSVLKLVLAELRRPERQAEPRKHPICGKQKETRELIFSWSSWLAVLLVGAYARRRGSRATWRPLPSFKPWRSRYESVNYEISNYWFTQSERAYRDSQDS